MDPEVYKLILNVREVTERNKTLTFVNCKVRFNQTIQSAFVPFRQSLIFSFTPQERHKNVEFRFEKDYREIGRYSLSLDSHYLTNRFEIEKWYELESTDKGNKVLAKISFNIMKYPIETSRSRVSFKHNNFVETRAMEGSPRLSYLTNRLSSYIKNPRTPNDEQYSQISPHQSIIDYNQGEYMSCPHASLSSRHLDLRLNLQSAVRNLRGEISPKDQPPPTKSRDTKLGMGLSKMMAEPLTYREREAPERRPISRKTKSLEKPVNLSALEKEFKVRKNDESRFEDSRTGSPRISFEGLKSDSQDLKLSGIEAERKSKEQEKYLEQMLRDGNSKMRQENKKLEEMIWDVERARDKYEMENKRLNEKLDFYMEKCSSFERELLFTQSQLALWKSKAEIIRLLENELEGLRRILKERDKNAEIERVIMKKRTDFEKAMRELQEENIKYREKIQQLELELEDITKKNHVLRQEKEKSVSESMLLKVRIAALEVNEEQLKHLTAQKEEIFEEIEMLRSANKQLRELIMDQKDTLWQSNEQQNLKFNESISKLKARVDNLSTNTLSHLQSVQKYLVSNLDLKDNLEKLEELYSYDEDSDIEPYERRSADDRRSHNISNEVERNLDMIKTFTDNNKRLEKYIHDAKTLKRENLVSGKHKSVDFNASTSGLLKVSPSLSNLNKPKLEKLEDIGRKPLYVPVKDDLIDARLADFVNSHQESRKLFYLFKRKLPGIYIFGTLKVCPKLENGRLYIREGQTYLSIDSFVSLHLDIEYERLVADNSKAKKSQR